MFLSLRFQRVEEYWARLSVSGRKGKMIIKNAKACLARVPDVARAPSPLQGAAPDVARAPSPLHGRPAQGRGGLAASAMLDTVQTWKSVSSHRINKLLGRRGALWQSDYYNHIIRTPSEYANQLDYVLRNNLVLARHFAADVARAPSPLQGVAPDVARAPSPLQARRVPQGRGGLATPGGDVASAGFFPGKDCRYWPDMDVCQGESLPRWSMERAIYHICFRLADSVPQSKLREWEAAREEFRFKQKNGDVLSEDELRELKNLYSDNIERYLDSGYGECLLMESGVAELIVETLLHGNGKGCVVHAVGIMPNHVHVIAGFDEAREPDVARAPSPLHGRTAQGRGGLATSCAPSAASRCI